ncbi:MAG: NADH-quinone oxidoreductase subunit N [Holophagales bacterium]|nr:MAG: NADH-quinone oxidoreductase subunit N [Holophagales bacterium]
MTDFVVRSSDLAALAPEIWLASAATLLLLLEAFVPKAERAIAWLALAAVGVASWLVVGLPSTSTPFGGLVLGNGLTSAWSQLLLLATAFCLLSSRGYLTRERLASGEYEALLLWCCSGLLLLVRSAELLTLFLALELFSLALYALAAFHRRIAWSTESAIKYFLMGAFVSSFVLYGIALVYGQTGTTRLADIVAVASRGVESPALLVLGLLLLVAGFAFKMSLFPFHAWSPDVYQGAPSPFVGFLSVAPKAASAFVLANLLMTASGTVVADRWPSLVALLAVCSMVVGNLLALVQRDLKRMLAYSGIAQMGYAIIPLASLDGRAFWRPLFVYLAAYVLMNSGAFAVITLLYRRAGEQHSISELSGWGYRFPLLSACLTVCMLSLAGIPPTAGFLGKYLVFLHAIEHGQAWLALVGIAASLVGVVYYLRVIYVLFMKEEECSPEGLPLAFGGRATAILAAAGTLALGIWPGRLLAWIQSAAGRLTP